MVLESEVEVLIPIIVSIIFSLLYEMNPKEMVWAGITAMACWLITGIVFLMVSSYPVIALIFMAVFLIYLVRIMVDWFRPISEGRVLH